MTRKLTIAGAFLLMAGLLATFGNADDVPTSSEAAPAEIQIPQSASPIILAEKAAPLSTEVTDDPTSVLTVNTPDTELTIPETIAPELTTSAPLAQEPRLFALPQICKLALRQKPRTHLLWKNR